MGMMCTRRGWRVEARPLAIILNSRSLRCAASSFLRIFRRGLICASRRTSGDGAPQSASIMPQGGAVSGSGGLERSQLFQRGDVLQNHFDHVFVAEFGVDHQVVERAVGPIGIEVVPDKRGALAVDVVVELKSFLFGLAAEFES